jgi:hypothetical protein
MAISAAANPERIAGAEFLPPGKRGLQVPRRFSRALGIRPAVGGGEPLGRPRRLAANQSGEPDAQQKGSRNRGSHGRVSNLKSKIGTGHKGVRTI